MKKILIMSLGMLALSASSACMASGTDALINATKEVCADSKNNQQCADLVHKIMIFSRSAGEAKAECHPDSASYLKMTDDEKASCKDIKKVNEFIDTL